MKNAIITISFLSLIIFCSSNSPIIGEKPFVTENDKKYTIDHQSYYDTVVKLGHSTFRIFKGINDTFHHVFGFTIHKKVNNTWSEQLITEWTSLYEFKDWNKDGYLDIVLRYHHAYVPILFNPKKEIFVRFGDIGELTDQVTPINGTNLMWNFTERKNWHSELFDIDSNYNMKSYGVMINYDESKLNSDIELEKDFICTYKRLLIYSEDYNGGILGHKKLLMNRFDPNKLAFNLEDNSDDYDSLRIAFIKNYWNNNWQKFIN
ncbi:MAG: hypothetical protein JNL70_04350 [Saprospiraceae bacterium]|nr:hypothetical protein [Saprospiraceae bacterium]